MHKLHFFLEKRDRQGKKTLKKIKEILADDDLQSPRDKISEIIKIAAPGLRIEREISQIFRDTADLLARHLLYRQNFLHLIWLNLIRLGDVRQMSDREKVNNKAIYWEGALSVMNEVADAALLHRLNRFIGRADHQVDPEEFLRYWVELAERLYEYFFDPTEPRDGWRDGKGLQSLMLKAAKDQPRLAAILTEKKKVPVILDDGIMKGWILIKANEHQNNRGQAHLEADRIIIDHLISMGYMETGRAFQENIVPADRLHSDQGSNGIPEKVPE